MTTADAGLGSHEARLAQAEQLWLGGRPLEAGRVLWGLVPEAHRARWAGRVLAWVRQQSTLPADLGGPQAVAAVIAATLGAAAPDEAAVAYREIDAALRRAEASGRFNSLEEAVLALARNAARLVPGAVEDAPAPSAGWWFVASLKCVGDELGPQFASEAWPVLARLD